MASRLYDFTLAAAVGAAQKIDAMGRRITLMTCSQDYVDVRIPELGVWLRMAPGQTYTAPDGVLFRDVMLANRAGSVCAGELFIGDGSLTDNSVAGTVGTRAQEYARTVSETAFFAMSAMVSATDAPAVQVHAKPANTRRMVIDKITFSSTSFGKITLSKYAGTLTNVYTDQPVSKLIVSAGWMASGEVETRYQELAAALGTPLLQTWFGGNSMQTISLPVPVVLDPGQSLVLKHSQTGAVSLDATFEGYMLA